VNSNRSQTFQYDLLGRVTQAIGFYGTDTMTYDGIGNLLTRSRVSGGTTSVTYSYNRNTNQISKATPQTGSALSYSYDADGNMLTRALGKTTQVSIAYNADGRPKTASGETFTYDGFGERVLLAFAGGGTHDIFGLDHELLAENNTTGQAQRSYIYLNGVPLAVVDSFGQISYVLSGQLGQPQKMVNSGGALVWDQITDEFGQVVSQPVGQTSANSLRFPGQIADAATGLNYNYFRDYDPALGRYIQTDPIGLAGGSNLYAYVDDNPLSYTDPKGEILFLATALGGAVGGGVGDLIDQLARNKGDISCVNLGELATAAAFGGAAGAAAPFVTVDSLSAAGLGAAANVAQYLYGSGDNSTLGGAAFAAGTGAVGGFIAGPVKNPFMFFKPSPFSPSQAAAAANSGTSSLIRNALGGAASNSDSSGDNCGCK
jgi:RHS repeat-associated protein